MVQGAAEGSVAATAHEPSDQFPQFNFCAELSLTFLLSCVADIP
jgi:hypothetical protein